MPMIHRMPLAALATALLLGGCGGSDKPLTTGPGPSCDPTISVSPTIVALASGGSAPLTAAIVPCSVAKKAAWTTTDASIASVAATTDTTAVVTGGQPGNTTVVVSVAAFPGAHAVVVVQVR